MAVFSRRYLLYRLPPREGKRTPLLWPVRVHRVIYPEERPSGLNLFQRAVLGLVRTGCYRTEEIAAQLGLHPEMATLILAQCQSKQWLDSSERLTPAGHRVIEDDPDADLELKSGILFQDGITGKLWPRLASELLELESEPGDRPAFIFKRATGKVTRPFLLPARAMVNISPDRSTMLEAYRRYRLDHFNASQLYGRDALPEKVKINGIEPSGSDPEPMYVLTWLQEGGLGARPWRVLDPFDIRDEVPWLDDTIADLVPTTKPLAKELERILGAPQPETQSVTEWMRNLENMVGMEMLTEHPWTSRQRKIARYYQALRRRIELMDQGLGKHELESALTDAQKLCESVCEWMIKEFKPDLGAFPPTTLFDRDVNISTLKLLELPALTENAIRVLSSQQLSDVRRALEGDVQSLKAMLFGIAFCTLNHPNHPLRHLRPEQLAFDQLLELAGMRNRAAHASDMDFEQDIVRRLSALALNWTLLFEEWM